MRCVGIPWRKASLALLLCAGGGLVFAFQAASPVVRLPVQQGSVRVAIIGDSGSGSKGQYELAAQMVKTRNSFPFDTVLMLGDNIYGSQSPASFKNKFEKPYQPLLEGGVRFFASLGNHDNPNSRFYKPFRMEGQRYYSFRNGDVEFFALDSTYLDPVQLDWIAKRLAASPARWKICYFHHPLYSSGRRHGPDLDLRARLEPVLEKGGVNVVLAGHEHFYERLKPQKGIQHFVLGNSGKLRMNNIKRSLDTIKGFDRDLAFGLFEITGDQIFFQAISRTGEIVDSGVIERRGLTGQ
jgi:hypothetical protein